MQRPLARNATGIVVVGGSAGCLPLLKQIVASLPARWSIPVVVVMHLPESKGSMLATVLGSGAEVSVREAESKTALRSAVVHVAPPGYHLLIEDRTELSLSLDAPVLYARPSIDVLFESAANAFGDGTLGIVLSGANADGAEGALAIAEAGGRVFVQRPSSATAAAMPEAALERCSSARSLDPDELVSALVELVP